MLRLSWTQPEDLVTHALVAAELDGADISGLRAEWLGAGGAAEAPVAGATKTSSSPALVDLARRILRDLDALPVDEELLRREPDELPEIFALATKSERTGVFDLGADELRDRVLGAWLGRASGCLLGKPVEKVQREGIRAIAESTGNWPIASYFTERGLSADIAERYPWNRRSRPTSLVENIDGMPEDDDLNFPLIALELLERVGHDFSTDDVAQSWLANLPGGRVFTAERIVYRNLLDGIEPELAGRVGNPFSEWIGAQIRTDVYGWANPGNPRRAAELAWRDARLSHRRSGLYGAMFVAAACASAVAANDVDDVLAAGLGVVPSGSRYAAAINFGAALGREDVSLEEALDRIGQAYGHLHWVHALNNSALLAFALIRGRGDFERTITTAVAGGWDTDSVGATAGSVVGALRGADELPARWIEPLKNRLASSVPGFDGIGFDVLAARTVAAGMSA